LTFFLTIKGDTVWEDSQLVASAKRGSLCVLDGIDKGSVGI
jgi:hypothetical protein